MEGKNVTQVFFENKCIMEYDFSEFTYEMTDAEQDKFYERFNEFWNYMRDLAFEKSALSSEIERNINELWEGNDVVA